jgi:outer membrane protein insertion porin family
MVTKLLESSYDIMKLVRHLPARCPCLVLLLAAVQAAAAFSQSPVALSQSSGADGSYRKYEDMVVTNIRFDPAEQPLEASVLHDILPLKMNQPLHVAEVRAAIERLFETGRYADIRVDAAPYRGGVALTLITSSRWFIGDVSVRGAISSPPHAGQLASAGGLNLGEPFSEAKVEHALAEQQRLLEANGLFGAELHPVFDWESTKEYQQVNIRFEVTSGPRARFTTPGLTGDLKMDQGRVANALKFRRWLIHTWKPMTQSRIRQGLDSVRALYEKDRRLEAKVSLDSVQRDAARNAALATFHIEAGPRIQVNPVGFKLSQKVLQRHVPIFEEHAVDNDLLVEGANNLRDYLQSQGYFDAEVAFKQQNVINDRANIDYLINTGRRHRLVSIEIAGNKYFSSEAIRERMFLQKANFLQFPHGRYSESLLRRDEESIRNLYESNGFREVAVTHRTEDNYRGKSGDIAVFIKIVEGPQYRIHKVQVDGIEKLDRNKLLAALSSSEGQPFSEFNVAVDRDTILAQYFEKGFPRATFEWSSTPAADPHQIDLHFVINEGPQQFVRQVVITGNRRTRTDIINSNITLNPGDPLSPTEITEIQRRLYALGVFARVDTAIQDPEGETDRKYLLYNVDEARPYSMAVGFGAELGRLGGCQTCLDNPTGVTGFSPRVSIDLTRSNLWGITHTISLRTRVSTLDQRALLNYSWPHFRRNDNLTISFTALYENSQDIRTFSFKRQELAAQLTQRFTKSITLFYRVSYRRVGVSDLKITPFLIPQLSQPLRVGMGSLNFVQDRRDDPLDPHKGIYNTLDLGLADHVFGSQRNFVRFLARNSTYHQLTKRLVLARSTQFGDVDAFHFNGDALEAIPLAERFFGGGGTSHRGFPENQAGPRDTSTGFPLGGTALLFNQTELRFPLIGDNIGAVLYHDMGNIYSSAGNISFRVRQRDNQDFDYMVHAVGVGLRYRTPVGPVRADLGYSINPPQFFGFKGTQQDLINAGVTPCSPPAGVANQCVQQGVSHFQFFFSIGQTF